LGDNPPDHPASEDVDTQPATESEPEPAVQPQPAMQPQAAKTPDQLLKDLQQLDQQKQQK
jgi:hypothetical protein